LKNLQKLNLRDNDVSDLTPLANLTRLEYLDLYSNMNIKSIQPLEHLTNLKTLILANVPVGEQTSVIANFKDLEHLNLRNCGIKDLGFLAGMDNLDYLNLYSDTEIQDIQILQEFTGLHTLILSNVSIGDQIVYLKDLTHLRYLNLCNTDISDISSLSHLINLLYLNIHSNEKISSIEPLKNLTALQTLIMVNVPVKDQTKVFDNFPDLHRLNIRDCQISDISFVGRLMSHGILQDDAKKEISASVDVRDNVEMQADSDPYAALRPYWKISPIGSPSICHFIPLLQLRTFHSPRFLQRQFSIDNLE
jgi:Leucine-rich repeat (LRR) protein